MTNATISKNFIKSTYTFIALLFLVKAVFSNIIYDTYTIDRILVTMYMSIFIIYISITDKAQIFDNFFKNPFFYFGLYSITQAFFSPYIKGNFEEHQQIFIGLLILLFICFTNLSISNYFKVKDFTALILFFSTIVALLLFFDTAYFSITSNENYSIYKSIIKYFKNIRVLNHLQVFIVPALFICFTAGKNSIKLLASILTIFNGYLVAYTGARGLFITLLIMSVIFYSTIGNKNIKKKFRIFLGMLLIGMILCFLQTVISHNKIGNIYNFINHTASGRMEIYKTILPCIINTKYFLFAIGFSSQDIAVTHFLHPHNLFLYVFLGTGTVGLLYFLFATSTVLLAMQKKYTNTKSWSKKITYLSLLSLFVYSMVSGVYITPLTYFYAVLNIWSIANKNKTDISSVYYVAAKIASIAIVLASIFYLFFVVNDAQQYDKANKTIHKTILYHPGVILISDSIYN